MWPATRPRQMDDMNRIAILSNAGSGRNRRRTALLADLDALSGVDHRVTRCAQDVPAALDALLRAAPAVLAINGGDGTVQTVLTALAARTDLPQPAIAILPAGSTNMSAGDLGCGGRLANRLAMLLALRDQPVDLWPRQLRSPLQVTTATGERRLGFFFGIGTIVRGIDYWHHSLAHGGGAGEWGAGAALARAAWGIFRRQPPFAEPVRVRLAIDDAAPRDLDLMFLLVTPLRRLFLGLRPFWGPGPGPLALTWVDDRPQRFLPRVPSLLRGRAAALPAAEGYHGHRPAAVQLEVDESWVIDGEVFAGPARLRIESAAPMQFVALDGTLPGLSRSVVEPCATREPCATEEPRGTSAPRATEAPRAATSGTARDTDADFRPGDVP